MHMLDTNICSYLLKSRPASVLERFRALDPGDLAVSEVVVGELRYGVELLDTPRRALQLQAEVDDFLSRLRVLPWAASREYGRVRAHLKRQGTLIGNLDLMIGAHALAMGATLVTHNTREFLRIPDLVVEDWA